MNVDSINTTITVTMSVSEAECIKRACEALYKAEQTTEQYGPAKHIVAMMTKTLEDLSST